MRLTALTSLFVLLGALALPGADLHAQGVTLRCGTGVPPNGGTVQTNGFVINGAGEVVFGETSIACNVQQNPGLPPSLILSITAPPVGTSVDVTSAAQNVAFGAQINNYDANFDACTVQVFPPAGAPWSALALNPNSGGAATQNIVFAQGIGAGTYRLELDCERESNGQQILVNPVSRTVTVVSGVLPPPGCLSTPIPPVFQASPLTIVRNYTDAFTDGCNEVGNGGLGGQPNEGLCARGFNTKNSLLNGALTQAQLRSWKFRPNANSRMRLLRGTGGSGTNTISISECPGQYGASVPAVCKGSNSTIFWSSRPGDVGYCQLDPTKDYYINSASFNLPEFLSSGDYVPADFCAGNCQMDNIWKVQPVVQP